MRKNLISVIILAICIVNLVLNALMVFVFLPTMKKTDNLVTEIASILNLELERDPSGQPVTPNIEDVQTYTLAESITVNLKEDGTGKTGFAMVGISISMDGSSKDYESINSKLADTESWISDVSRSVIQEYTYEEVNQHDVQTEIKKQITEGLQERYQTNCIYDVTFSQFATQQLSPSN